MLAKEEKIVRALSVPKARNKLLNYLSQKQGSDEDQYRFSLAWILGSFLRLSEIKVIKYPLLIVLYQCVLFLENQAQLMIKKQPQQALAIRKSLEKLLLHVNQFYRLYATNPEIVRVLWEEEIFQLQSFSTDAEINAVSHQCLQELALLKNNPEHLPIKFLPSNNSLASFTMKSVFGFRQAYSIPSPFNSDFSIEHLFIPNELEELLDGYLFSKKSDKKSYVVLCLFNQNPPECSGIFLKASSFYNWFNANVFLLKTREKSFRTQTMPLSVEDLGQDILSVAHFFQERGQQIILYGLCGAVAPMVHAAKQLHDEKKPFKLIADRFADSFSSITSPNNAIRIFKTWFRDTRQANIPLARKLIFFVLACFIFPAGALLIYLSAFFLLPLINGRQNYGEQIRDLPLQNVLILQARGPKRIGNAARLEDEIISPKYELRKATSARRKLQKALLLTLGQSVEQIIAYLEIDCSIRQSLVNLRYFFNEAIKLIADEKLTSVHTNQNIHASHLFNLRTRNQLEPGRLIQGFLYPRHLPVNWNCLPAYDLEHIQNCLTQMRTHIKKPIVNFSPLSSALLDFLNRAHKNADFLSYMAKRLAGSRVIDISPSLKLFLEEGLLTTIKSSIQSDSLNVL